MRPAGPTRTLASCGSFARAALLAVVFPGAALLGCYEGPGPLEPPPGSPGGACHEPAGTCDPAWVCEAEGRYCYDPSLPCRGVFCGEHGACQPDKETGLPVCYCDQGYSNATYSLYCEEL